MDDTSDVNYYRILQVDPHAEPEVISAAYRRLALKYHPDVDHSPQADKYIKALNLAYEILRDPERRRAYDAKRGRHSGSDTYQASYRTEREHDSRSTESYANDAVEPFCPRFDGLYVAPSESDKTYFSYLRFFPSQRACAVTSSGSSHQVARWLLPNGDHGWAQYWIDGPRIRIRHGTSRGAVEYDGTISEDLLELQLHSHSHINGHKSFNIWKFERVDQN